MRPRDFAPIFAGALVGACSRSSPRVAPEAGVPQAPTLEQAVLESDAARLPGGAPDVDTDASRAQRARLVEQIERSGYVKSKRVLDAMRRVPRHAFVPGAPLDEAYGDWPLPIGSGQTISQPTVVGEMTDVLELRGTERVLEIGTGSGYQAAVLSLLAKEVYTIEIVPELGERAEKRLRDLGYANVHVRVGDGYAGWPEHAPFDRIIVTAAPPEVPKALLEQLAEGGILVAPVGEQWRTQWLVRLKKENGHITEERLEPVQFVPMVPKRR